MKSPLMKMAYVPMLHAPRRLVSFITGFKNSLKGAGYFLGAVTVAVNYYLSLGACFTLCWG